jgi:hypothetical protein
MLLQTRSFVTYKFWRVQRTGPRKHSKNRARYGNFDLGQFDKLKNQRVNRESDVSVSFESYLLGTYENTKNAA